MLLFCFLCFFRWLVFGVVSVLLTLSTLSHQRAAVIDEYTHLRKGCRTPSHMQVLLKEMGN